MTAPSKQQEKFINLLRELFQLNQPDLDFGLYRIMHAKAAEIEKFLNEDLLAVISKTFAGGVDEKIARAKDAYERELQNATEYGVADPVNSPKAQQALAAYNDVRNSAGEDAEIFDHLYRFFERYYDQGDFLSRRYYARETSEKASPYAVPYDGSEVYLHWANKDQYYIKTTESFNQFSFDLALAQDGNAQLFSDATPRKVHFKLVDAEEGEHNNVKATSDKDRFFIVDQSQPIDWEATAAGEYALVVLFHYCADAEKPSNARNWRNTRNAKNQQVVLDALQAEAKSKNEQALLAQNYHAALTKEVSKGSKAGETQPLIARYLNQYTASNTMDYFIHKDLGGFLKRELDFYLKNEVLRLDDLGIADQPQPDNYTTLLKKLHTLRSIAHKLIDFLAQTEEFQKKLWLKKKFVVDTQWLITLDKIPTSLYPQIVGNDAQWVEWHKLGFVTVEASRDELLKLGNKLVLDTRFFDNTFTAQVLSNIDNLDASTDGLLIQSENFQALNLMQEMYREQVKCIYIDPPYNTGNDGFAYKDSYRHSSWIAMLRDRLVSSRALLSPEGVFYTSYGDKDANNRESSNYSLLLDSIFLQENWVDQLVVVKSENGMGSREGFATNHEYIFCYKNGKVGQSGHFMGLSPSEEYLASFDKKDQHGAFKIDGLLKKKGEGARREDSPNCFYPIYYNPITGECALNPSKSLKEVYPKLPNGDDGRWTWSPDFAKDKLYKLHAGSRGTVYIKDYLSPERMQKPKSVLRNAAYLTDTATNEIKDFFGYKAFSTPKPVTLLKDIIENGTDESSIVLDFFAGSGATGESVIRLNKKDKIHRKYILVEMGDYFDSVTKPRIAKVSYSADWKDGKPTKPESGVSQLVKVIRLESYEDTVNNLEVADVKEQQLSIEANHILREEYYLNYLLDMTTRGSPSLLNLSAFSDPAAYAFNIKSAGTDTQVSQAVDLVETFNWLIGLYVKKLHVPIRFNANLAREDDTDLPAGSTTRLCLKGRLQEDPNGTWWFRSVEGLVKNTGGSQREQRVLIVWRKLTGNLEQDNTVLAAYLAEYHIIDVQKPTLEVPFDVIYINGSHNLPMLAQCDIRLLEDTFHQKMWDVKDV